jgi:molecular chaperone HscB
LRAWGIPCWAALLLPACLQVLEAREEVEATDDPKRLKALLSANRGKQQALVAQLSQAFARGDLSAAAGLTTQLTYLAKLEHEIVDKVPLG